MIEEIKIKSGKYNIHADLYLPIGGQSKPAVIILPEFLGNKRYEHYVNLAERLKFLGHIVICFNPIGTWDHDDTSLYSVSQYLSDFCCVEKYTWENYGYALEVILCGHSLGGMIALLSPTNYLSCRARIAIMPPQYEITKRNTESREEWREKGFKISIREFQMETRNFRVPYSFEKDRSQYCTLDGIPISKSYIDIKEIQCPFLFIAGERDAVVSPENVWEIYKRANKPKRFVVLEGVQHNYRENNRMILKVNNQIINFLDENKL